MKNDFHFEKLQQALEAHLDLMQHTAQAIIDQDISNYPIFLVNEMTPALGINILAFDFEGKGRIVSATTLEELATKGVMDMEKVDNFKVVYKKNDQALCLLIAEENEAQFIFLPKKG